MFGTKAHLRAENDHLFIEGVDALDLAKDYGTPLYVTSEARLRQNVQNYHKAFPDADKYFAVKANGSLAILRILAQEGMGADVSWAESSIWQGWPEFPKMRSSTTATPESERDHLMALEAGVRMSVDSREELVRPVQDRGSPRARAAKITIQG